VVPVQLQQQPMVVQPMVHCNKYQELGSTVSKQLIEVLDKASSKVSYPTA
jgi:hypothetical protein